MGSALDPRSLASARRSNRQLMLLLPMFLPAHALTLDLILRESVGRGLRFLLLSNDAFRSLLKNVYISAMTQLQVAVPDSEGRVMLWEQYQVRPHLPTHLTRVGCWISRAQALKSGPSSLSLVPETGTDADEGLKDTSLAVSGPLGFLKDLPQDLHERSEGLRLLLGAGVLLGPREELASRRGDLDGTTLRCMADDFQPLTIPDYGPAGDYRVTGSFVDIMAILERSLNFTCSWSRPEDRAWGALQPDGTWNGMIGDLMADKGDVIVAISRTLPREEVVDFTLPLLLDRHILVLRRPGTANSGISWSSYTQEFSSGAWAGAAMMVLFMGSCITLITRYSRSSGGHVPFTESILLILGAACQQGTKQDIQGTAGRIVLLTALLLGTVTYIHYTSFLISALSVNRLLLPFTTLAELTRVDSHQLMVLKSTVQEDVLKLSTNPVYQKAWANIQAGGEWGSVATNDVGFAKVLEGKNVYLTTESEYSYQYGGDSRILALTKEKYIAIFVSVAVTKKSQLKELFDNRLVRMRSAGLLSKILKDWGEARPPPLPNAAPPLSLAKTGSAFLLLAAGTALSLCALGMEVLVTRCLKRSALASR
nr:probable glutamate receptor [Penaeus vannamei]